MNVSFKQRLQKFQVTVNKWIFVTNFSEVLDTDLSPEGTLRQMFLHKQSPNSKEMMHRTFVVMYRKQTCTVLYCNILRVLTTAIRVYLSSYHTKVRAEQKLNSNTFLHTCKK